MKQRTPINIDTVTYRRAVYQQKSETPHYSERLAAGEILPDLPYMMFDVVSEAASYRKWSTWRQYDPNSILIPPSVGCIRDNDYQIGARTANEVKIRELLTGRDNKLLSKIKGQTLPLLMLYKERHQTGRMVTKMLDDMVFFARNYRRPSRLLAHYGFARSPKRGSYAWRNYRRAIRRYNAGNAVKTVGDYYLEWRFGWGPLYNDLETALKASAEAEKKGIRTSARAGLAYEFEDSVVNTAAPHAGSVDGHCVSKGYYGIKATYHITDVLLASAVQIMEVPETLWDALPWSFIIDRVVNISKYLNLRNATAGTEFISGHRSDYRVHTITGMSNVKVGRVVAGDPIYWHTEWKGPPRVEVSFTRSLMTGFPSPKLEYPWKDFFGNNTYIADYAALINQRFNRPVRRFRRGS